MPAGVPSSKSHDQSTIVPSGSVLVEVNEHSAPSQLEVKLAVGKTLGVWWLASA